MKHYSLSLNILLALLAIAVATLPVVLSQQLHRKMVADERAKMELWAEATEGLASDSEENALNLMLHIIQSNETIPILLVTDRDSIVSFNNISIPEGRDTLEYLSRYLAQVRGGYPPIAIDLGAEGYQYLYYSDSSTLESLTLFPWLQGVVFILFVGIVIIAAVWAKRNAQNRLWVGLSKETAHQLGTPISSLLAWLELLRAEGIAEESLVEMDKDVERLQTIAHRFQKIGSEPHSNDATLPKRWLPPLAIFPRALAVGSPSFTTSPRSRCRLCLSLLCGAGLLRISLRMPSMPCRGREKSPLP